MHGSVNRAVCRRGLVADVGRTTVRVGLTDSSGVLDQGSVREYDPQTQPTISTAIAAFGLESGLAALPDRAAIAVSGVPRGEVISITNSRWILSRRGLAAMFQSDPLIINDFAANAWAISSRHCNGRIEQLGDIPLHPYRPGNYCIIGMGSGLGVALLSRDEHGSVNVVATEGGHMGLMDGLPDEEGVLDKLRAIRSPVHAEGLFSGPGLLALHAALCSVRGERSTDLSLGDLLNASRTTSDPVVRDTFAFFAKAFWHFAGNMVLAYGAWDGVILTGSIVEAVKPVLLRPEWKRHFFLPGAYERRLRQVPSATASFQYAELEGAAVALLVEDARRGWQSRTAAATPAPAWTDAPLAAAAAAIESGAFSSAIQPSPHWGRRPACC